ncbi:UbiA prenyltransferase family [Xylaria longipes]|nr:UbiA prenyltransferase family [Xylaria longipes]
MDQVNVIWSHIFTLFLFTKSDFKTVIFPQAIFALGAASYIRIDSYQCLYTYQSTVLKIPAMLAWIWIHLLVENLANQRLPTSIIEDKTNKPWRPIPAGRLTPTDARTWLQFAIMVALIFSIYTETLLPSTTLMTMIWLYNDLEGSSRGPFQRNVINAAGLGCFGWGGVCVLLGSCTDMDSLAPWSFLIGTIVATTVHVQDFPDIDGDNACGRRTAPLVYGDLLARGSVAVLTPICTTNCWLCYMIKGNGY